MRTLIKGPYGVHYKGSRLHLYSCFKASERNRNVILDLKPSKVEAKANGPPPVIHKQV